MKKTLVVGLGGGGMSMAKYVHHFLGCDALAVNTDADSLKKSDFKSKLLIGSEICKGDPAATVERVLLATQESTTELTAVFANYKTLILIVGLGGGAGTCALPVAITLANTLGKKLVVAVTIPFGFESARRDIALAALPELRLQNLKLLTYDFDALLKNPINHKVSLLDVFEHTTHQMAEEIKINLNCND